METTTDPEEKPARKGRKYFIVEVKDDQLRDDFQKLKQRFLAQFPKIGTMTDAAFLKHIINSLSEFDDYDIKIQLCIL